jgi:hypothetical protein
MWWPLDSIGDEASDACSYRAGDVSGLWNEHVVTRQKTTNVQANSTAAFVCKSSSCYDTTHA